MMIHETGARPRGAHPAPRHAGRRMSTPPNDPTTRNGSHDHAATIGDPRTTTADHPTAPNGAHRHAKASNGTHDHAGLAGDIGTTIPDHAAASNGAHDPAGPPGDARTVTAGRAATASNGAHDQAGKHDDPPTAAADDIPTSNGSHDQAGAAGDNGLLLLDDAADSEPPLVGPAPYRVSVIRSENRRKTVSARVVGGVIEVRIPSWLPPADEKRVVDNFVRNFEKRRRCWQVDLGARARHFAAAYDLPEPRSITWSTRQRQRWGSCSVLAGNIRISHRLAEVPPWVLDYVIVHELAHLAETGHTPAFHALVNRFPRAERAIGYLQAFDAMSDPVPE